MSADTAVERRPGPMAEAAMVARQVRYEQLSFWLNRIGALFTVAFSLVFLSSWATRRAARPTSGWAAPS